jgi:hypothetical protein
VKGKKKESRKYYDDLIFDMLTTCDTNGGYFFFFDYLIPQSIFLGYFERSHAEDTCTFV